MGQESFCEYSHAFQRPYPSHPADVIRPFVKVVKDVWCPDGKEDKFTPQMSENLHFIFSVTLS